MSNKYIAEYCPLNSIIHMLNPAIKIINLMIIMVMLIISSEWVILSYILVVSAFMLLLSKVPSTFYFRIIFTFIPLYMLIFLSLVASGLNLELAGMIILKIIIFLLNLSFLVHTTSSNEIVSGTMKIVNVINFLEVNLNKLGIFIFQLIKFIPTFNNTLYQILNSQASRGIDYKYVTMIGRWKAIIIIFKSVIIHTFQKLKNIGHNMEQKLFILNRNQRKINFKNIHKKDYFFLILHLIIIAYFVYSRVS